MICGCCKMKRLPIQFIKNERQMKSCEVCRQRASDYNATHKQERYEYNKQWRKNNPELVKQLNRNYRTANKDKLNEKQKIKNKLIRDLLANLKNF